MKFSRLKTLISAIFFIGAVMILGYAAGWWNFTLGSDCAWTLIPMGVAAVWVFIFGANIINSLLFFGGAGALLYMRGIVPEASVAELCLAMAMMSVAMAVMGGYKGDVKDVSDDGEDVKQTFFATDRQLKCSSNSLKSASVKASCCNATVDLSEAVISPGAKLEFSAKLGRVEVILPGKMKYTVNSAATCGGVANKLASPNEGDTADISAKALFGRVILKNKAEDAAQTSDTEAVTA